MSITPIAPATPGKPDVSDGDRVLAALTQAIEDQKKDMEMGQPARGVAIVWLRTYPDGAYGTSFIVAGMNVVEAIGLLHMAASDITDLGLDGGPLHFPKEPA